MNGSTDRWGGYLMTERADALREAADRIDAECQSLPRWPGATHDMGKIEQYVNGVLDAVEWLRLEAARVAGEAI